MRTELVRVVESDQEVMRLVGVRPGEAPASPVVARFNAAAAGAAIEFQQTVDHEQWSL